MAFKRIKDWATSITAFRTGDVIPVDGPDGSAKMSKDSLLQETAQNALAGNVAPAFDPTRTIANPYKAGESVAYNGKTYTFKVDHYGAWASADVEAKSITDLFKVIESNSLFSSIPYRQYSGIRIDTDYNVVSSGNNWSGYLINVPVGANEIELKNDDSNAYSYYIYFLVSNILVPASPAPVVYPISYEVGAGKTLKIPLPKKCSYVFVSTYVQVRVDYRFLNEDLVPVFVLKNVQIGTDGKLSASSNYKTFVIEMSDINSKFIDIYDISNNYFKSAYSVDDDIVVGSNITLYSGSSFGYNFLPMDTNTRMSVPVIAGVNYLLISAYETATFNVSKSNNKHKNASYTKREKITLAKTVNLKIPCVYGDDIVFGLTSTYQSTIGDIRVRTIDVSGSAVNLGYMSYGRFYTKETAPLSSGYSIVFGSGSVSVPPAVYRITAGLQDEYDCMSFRVAALNAGCFDHGESSAPTNPPSYGPEFVETWISLLKQMNADVILFSEWNERMTTGNDYLSKRKLLNNYRVVQESSTTGYYRNAIASKFDCNKNTTIIYSNQYTTQTRCFSYICVKIGNADVYFVVTHLELVAETRDLQIAELLTFFEDKEYVVIGGDFNCKDINEYSPFTDAGYDMANGDMWGVVFTYIGNSVSPAANYPTDNIAVKGLKLKDPVYPYNIDATDHKAVVADVYLI